MTQDKLLHKEALGLVDRRIQEERNLIANPASKPFQIRRSEEILDELKVIRAALQPRVGDAQQPPEKADTQDRTGQVERPYLVKHAIEHMESMPSDGYGDKIICGNSINDVIGYIKTLEQKLKTGEL